MSKEKLVPTYNMLDSIEIRKFLSKTKIEFEVFRSSKVAKVHLNIDKLIEELGYNLKIFDSDVQTIEVYIGTEVYKATEQFEVIKSVKSKGFIR